jgi:hypothetical protein
MMNCRPLPIILGLLVVLTTSATLQAHPFHATYTEVDWNAKKKVLEVALRVQPEDLERVLRTRAKRRVDLETTKGVDVLIQQYLAEVLLVVPQPEKPATIRWIGKEVSSKEAWLYFEIPRPQGIENLKLLNRIFLEILPDQVNTVRFRDGKKRKTLIFNRDSRKPVSVTLNK